MSGESTDHTDGVNDPAPVDPAMPAAAADVPDGSADAIVPAFDVPAPEMVNVPDAEAAAADFAMPPPPTFSAGPADAASSAETVQEKLDRAAPTVASSRAALRSAATSAPEIASVAPPPVPEGGSYRGWTITIFGGLAVLLIGAIGLMVFLGVSG